MNCSHGLRLEYKCELCTRDALSLLRRLPSAPPETASREQKQAFWAQQYRSAVSADKNPT
jgi:hypothetical protein